MALATLVRVAEGVKEILRQGRYSMPFTPQRLYIMPVNLEDLAVELTVIVTPVQMTNVNQSRAQEFAKTELVDVWIGRKLSGTMPADVDPYVLLAEEILDDLASKRSVIDGFILMLAQQNPIWGAGELDQNSCYATKLELTYRVL